MRITCVVFLLFTFPGLWSLRDVRLTVPSAVMAGDNITIGCSFTLEEENLYSLKFYLGDSEFYRYVPLDSPPTRVFKTQGVSVHLQGCDANNSTVSLVNVHRNMSGLYKCEVSADAPLFHTIVRSASVTVVEIPESPPSITTNRIRYSVGDNVLANCTSRGGYPPARLFWHLNGKQVHSGLTYYVMEGEVESSVLELRFNVTPTLSDRGRIRLRCIATQFTLYYVYSNIVLKEMSSQLVYIPSSSASITGFRRDASQTSILLLATMLLVVLTLPTDAFKSLQAGSTNDCVK